MHFEWVHRSRWTRYFTIIYIRTSLPDTVTSNVDILRQPKYVPKKLIFSNEIVGNKTKSLKIKLHVRSLQVNGRGFNFLFWNTIWQSHHPVRFSTTHIFQKKNNLTIHQFRYVFKHRRFATPVILKKIRCWYCAFSVFVVPYFQNMLYKAQFFWPSTFSSPFCNKKVLVLYWRFTLCTSYSMLAVLKLQTEGKKHIHILDNWEFGKSTNFIITQLKCPLQIARVTTIINFRILWIICG